MACQTKLNKKQTLKYWKENVKNLYEKKLKNANSKMLIKIIIIIISSPIAHWIASVALYWKQWVFSYLFLWYSKVFFENQMQSNEYFQLFEFSFHNETMKNKNKKIPKASIHLYKMDFFFIRTINFPTSLKSHKFLKNVKNQIAKRKKNKTFFFPTFKHRNYIYNGNKGKL
jgi:hypothetical protein